MTALVAAVFVASLMGSMHCAGMCGGFLAFAVGVAPGAEPSLRTRASLHAAYNAGRLATYTVLGAVAGAVGQAVDIAGEYAGLQRAALVAAGAMMVLFGAVTLLRTLGVPIRRAPLPRALQRLAERGHRAAMRFTPTRRALAVGLLTTLLPCGWLYAFVVTAAGTASPAAGALVMAVFWLGTLPVMISLGAGVQALAGPLRRHLPALTSIALVAVGLFTLSGRLHAPALAQQDAVNDPVAQLQRINSLDASDCPLCHDRPAQKH